MSRIVLASAEVLEYDAYPSSPQIITITSDADWVAEVPEWITVSPTSGNAGQTEVTISVNDNERDGLPDNPRKGTIRFKGRNLESVAAILIRQGGDKFRDPVDYTIDDMEAAEDETVVRLPGMVVTAVTGNGLIVTDGTQYAYITQPVEAVAVGDKVSIVGEKFHDNIGMAYVKGEKIAKEGTAAVPEKTPVDITSTLDQTNGKKYQYVTFVGDFDGTAVTVGESTCKAYLIDCLESLGVRNFGGHKIRVTGYFAGQASPVVNIIPAAVEDLGQNQVILFSEDFEWLSPWAIAGKDGNTPAGDTIGGNGTEAPKADQCKNEGRTATEELIARGYDFVSAHEYNDAKGKRDFALYLQQNYLKFNKTGNVDGKPYQEGLVLPPLKDIPANREIKISFDWCPQMQGDGMYDKTEMAVIVMNGDVETEIVAPGHSRADNSPYSWQNADLSLAGVELNEKTKIIIRNSNDAWAQKTAHRFYLDNIKIYYLP